MKLSWIHSEIISIVLLSLIPWPGPTVYRIQCSRSKSSLVRRLISKRWSPILEKYTVSLPMECVFHSHRDIYGPLEENKLFPEGPGAPWTCSICDKVFDDERSLEQHLEVKHKIKLNTAEDAICLADYCDVVRCDVLSVRLDLTSPKPVEPSPTDVQLWIAPPTSPTSLSRTPPTDMARTPRASLALSNYDEEGLEEGHRYGPPPRRKRRGDRSNNHASRHGSGKDTCPASSSERKEGEAETDGDDTCSADVVETSLPPRRVQIRPDGVERWRAVCDPTELKKLQTRCQELVHGCVASLLLKLSVQDFQDMEAELNKAVCWYLTCDRYWDDINKTDHEFPWPVVAAAAVIILVGMSLWYCIVWVVFESEKGYDDEGEGDGDEEGEEEEDYNKRAALLAERNYFQQQQQLMYHNYYYGRFGAAAAAAGVDIDQHGDPRVDGHNGDPRHQQMEVLEGRSASTAKNGQQHQVAGTDSGGSGGSGGQPEPYIYVTYPPELRKKLLESCYNRTTRL